MTVVGVFINGCNRLPICWPPLISHMELLTAVCGFISSCPDTRSRSPCTTRMWHAQQSWFWMARDALYMNRRWFDSSKNGHNNVAKLICILTLNTKYRYTKTQEDRAGFLRSKLHEQKHWHHQPVYCTSCNDEALDKKWRSARIIWAAVRDRHCRCIPRPGARHHCVCLRSRQRRQVSRTHGWAHTLERRSRCLLLKAWLPDYHSIYMHICMCIYIYIQKKISSMSSHKPCCNAT